jgi:hypothetical protein
MYGQIFSGVTLVVTTGSGLPNFHQTNKDFQTAPPGFKPDCGPRSMDCAAETAILAYFAGPPVGGPNAKATEEDALFYPGGTGAARVKWLSEQTKSGPSVLKGSPALVSRMLGGLQFKESFYKNPMDEGSASEPEQALLNVLKNYFKGTLVASTFDASATDNNNGETIRNAPINYLQIWEDDFIYANGWQNCSEQQLMTPPKGGSPPGCKVEDMTKHTVTAPLLGGTKLTALELLDLANSVILSYTAEPVALPPTCCSGVGYVPRGAFQGDPVCVSQEEQNQVQADNNAAVRGNSYSSNYTVVPTVPYGLCKQPPKVLDALQYRQAYMGDYVCVSNEQWRQVKSENASFPSHVNVGISCPALSPPGPLPGPLPGPRH